MLVTTINKTILALEAMGGLRSGAELVRMICERDTVETDGTRVTGFTFGGGRSVGFTLLKESKTVVVASHDEYWGEDTKFSLEGESLRPVASGEGVRAPKGTQDWWDEYHQQEKRNLEAIASQVDWGAPVEINIGESKRFALEFVAPGWTPTNEQAICLLKINPEVAWFARDLQGWGGIPIVRRYHDTIRMADHMGVEVAPEKIVAAITK